jgi:hypothetical protein
MKRDPALTSLSHDHHQALFVAQQLRRATAETAREARDTFLEFWEAHGSAHFRLEEEILLPAYRVHGDPHDPLVAAVLRDHAAIRRQADALGGGPPATAALQDLGARLADHVRLEERELFPLVESAMPPVELAALASALGRAERAFDDAQPARETKPPTIAP